MVGWILVWFSSGLEFVLALPVFCLSVTFTYTIIYIHDFVWGFCVLDGWNTNTNNNNRMMEHRLMVALRLLTLGLGRLAWRALRLQRDAQTIYRRQKHTNTTLHTACDATPGSQTQMHTHTHTHIQMASFILSRIYSIQTTHTHTHFHTTQPHTHAYPM